MKLFWPGYDRDRVIQMQFLFFKLTAFVTLGTWRKQPLFTVFLQYCVESTVGHPVIFSDGNRFCHELTCISGMIEGGKEAVLINCSSA
jgi:hypothetical protein